MFVTGLSDTERLGKSSVEILGDMGINETRLSNAVLALSESGGLLTDTVQLANTAWEENVALSNEASQRYETLESKIAMLKNSVSSLGVSIYEGFQEPLRNSVDLARGYISQLSDAFNTGGFDGLAEALGTVLGDAISRIAELAPAFFDMGISVIDSLIDGIINNSESISAAASKVFTSLLQAAFTIIPKLGSAAASIITQFAQGISESAPQLLETLVDGITLLIDAVVENLPLFMEAALNIILAIADALSENIEPITEAVLKITETFYSTLTSGNTIQKLCTAALSIISALADAFITNLDIIIPVAIQFIISLCTSLISSENISRLASAAGTILTAIVKSISDNLGLLISAAVEIINFLCVQLLNPDSFNTILTAAFDIISAILTGLIDNIDLLLDAALQIILFLCDALFENDNLQKIIQAAIDIILKLTEALIENLDKLINAAFQIILALTTELLKPENLSKIISAGIEILVKLIEGLGEFGENLGEFAYDFFSALGEAIRSIDWSELGKDIVEGICSGILDVNFNLDEFCDDFAENWKVGFKDAFGIHSPSRLMAKEVGAPIAQGVRKGFKDNIPDVKDEALTAFQKLETTADGFEFPLHFKAGITPVTGDLQEAFLHLSANVRTTPYAGQYTDYSVINSTENHTSGDTVITEENVYNIYTQAKTAADARSIAEELEFIKAQNSIGKGMR